MPLLSWLLNVAYVLLLIAVSPVVVYRMLVHGKYRDGWGQKLLGRLPLRSSNKPCVWFHAVSVGEVLQLENVLEQLASEQSDCEFLITTTTHTGLAVARKKFPQHEVCYFPLDFSWAVHRAIRRVRPSAVVLVELELWPNFLFEARRNGVPLALINGRISRHSFNGYRRIRPLVKRMLDCFESIAVQNDTYSKRLVELGAGPDRIEVTGSIKFDHVQTDRGNEKTRQLRQSFGIADAQRVFIAGSTQAPEEELALNTYLALKDEYPHLRLILVPRHQERFEEVAQLVERRGLPLIRRSRLEKTSNSLEGVRSDRIHAVVPVSDPMNRVTTSDSQQAAGASSTAPPILLLDTLGELAACWGLADIAFVGGSLTKRGGQNMIEPAAYGAAVLFGPNTRNFRDVVDNLLSGNAARVVIDGADLTAAVRDFLERPEAAREQGRTAQQLVLSQQGATRKTVKLIARLLPTTHGLQRRTFWHAA